MDASAAESGRGGSGLWIIKALREEIAFAKALTRLSGEHSSIFFAGPQNRFRRSEHARKRVRKRRGEGRSQQINIQLQIAITIHPVNRHGAATVIIASHEIEGQTPGVAHFHCKVAARSLPS